MRNSNLTCLFYISLLLYVSAASAQTGKTWTWNNTSSGAWNQSSNWLLDGATTTSYPAQNSTDQTINISSGTANNSSIDMDFYTTNINISGSGSVTQTTTHWSRYYSGQLNVTNGGSISIGANKWQLGAETNNTYSVLVDGGTFAYSNASSSPIGLFIGDGGATTVFTVQETISDGEGGYKASTFTATGPVYIGYETNSSGTLNISGGTVNASNSDFSIGSSGSAAIMTVSGTGTYNQNRKGNLVICGTDANDGQGSIVNLKAGGTIDTMWFSMGQSASGTNPTCTFNMTGGTLIIGEGGNGDFRISANGSAKSIVNLSGGTITAYAGTNLDSIGKGSQLNVIGPNVSFQGNTANFNSTGYLNYSIGTLDNITDGTLLSQLKFTGNALINSNVAVDMTVDGFLSLNGISNQSILSSNGALTWNPASTSITNGWEIKNEGNSVYVSLLESSLPTSAVNMGLASILGNSTETGMTLITGNANDRFTAAMQIEGDADEDTMSLLADWLNETSGYNVTVDSNVLFLSGLTLGEDGKNVTNFGIAGFNDLHNTNLTIGNYVNSNVTEPSTWILLIIGAAGLWFIPRKRYSRR